MTTTLLHRILPAVEIEASDSLSLHARAAETVVGAFALLLITWMLLAPVSGAVIALGAIKVDMNRRTLQHQEGGIVEVLNVRDGQQVKEGDVLMVLKDLRTNASNDLTQSQYEAELIRSARLNAEKLLAAKVAYPAEVQTKKDEPRVREIIGKEEQLFLTRRRALLQQVAILDQQAKQALREADAFRQKVTADEANLALQRDEQKANEGLVEKGFIASTRMMGIKRAAIDYETRLRQDQAELAAAEQKASDLQFRVESLRSQYMQTAVTELKEANAKLVELEERLRPVRDAAERLRITSPVDGEVVALRVTAAGALVSPRDPVMDIMPSAAKLVIEAKVRPEDAQQVVVGADVDVRLTGYKARITPTVTGTVTYLSSDRLTERTGNGEIPYFLMTVEVAKEELEKAGGLQLRAGMPTEVYVKTIARTPIEYLFDPLTAFFSRGLREQ